MLFSEIFHISSENRLKYINTLAIKMKCFIAKQLIGLRVLIAIFSSAA